MRAAPPAARLAHAAVHFRNVNADALNARFANLPSQTQQNPLLRAGGVMSCQSFAATLLLNSRLEVVWCFIVNRAT